MSIIKDSEHSVKDLEKINTVIDPRQKIIPFGGIWWLRSFIERLGVGDCWYGDPNGLCEDCENRLKQLTYMKY